MKMFGFFGGAKKPLKGYKITTVERKQKYGVAADSLKMLKDKASNKLKVMVVPILTSITFGYFFKKEYSLPDRELSSIFGKRWD